jgi:hypothetical protein
VKQTMGSKVGCGLWVVGVDRGSWVVGRGERAMGLNNCESCRGLAIVRR